MIKMGGISAFIASLCCVPPVLIVLLGVGGVSFAAGLGNVLYYQYRWVFITAGLLFMLVSLVIYYRGQGICTFDAVKRKRRQIINTTLILLATTLGIYLVFNYVVLEYIGVKLGIWELPAFLGG